MRKGLIYFLVLILISSLTFIIARGITITKNNEYGEVIENFGYIETKLLESSRYTQTEAVDPAKLAFYHANMKFVPDNEYLTKYNFVSYPELEDDKIKVYLEKDSFSIIVYDKVSNHYYSSRPTHQGFNGKLEGNLANRQRINSGIWIDYVLTNNPKQSNIFSDGLYNFADVRFAPGIQSPEAPFELVAGSYKKNNVEVKINKINGMLLAEVNIKKLKFKFNVEIKLTNGELTFEIPQASIEEEIGEYTVTAVTLFPYLGSTRENYFPAYTLIPDGVGALVRHDEPRTQVFNGRFYGDDAGYTMTFYNNLSVPLFGIIHEVNKSGLYAHITKGAQQSILTADFYTDNLNYNRASTKFYFRELHRRIIDRAGAGSDYIDPARTGSDYAINYKFLHNNANYVGIANDYRKYLLDHDLVEKVTPKDDITLHITYLMSDLEPSLFSKRRVTMTTALEVSQIYEELKEKGIHNQQTTLLGYSKEGVSSGLVNMNFFGNYGDYKQFFEEVHKDGNQVYLSQNYVDPSGKSKRINEIRDVAKNVSKLLMKKEINTGSGTRIDYNLKPYQSFLKARNDQKFLDKYNLGLQSESMGSKLFSIYDKQILDRTESMNHYVELAKLNDNLLLSRPNSYLWGHVDAYLNMPIANSQYQYYTDLVPLVPIILQGIMPKYTPYLNFNAMGRERLLQMVDFNIYPSYILTCEPTFKMRNTDSAKYYSTYYTDYKDEIINNYNFINNALKHTMGASIISREVLEIGVVKNTYSNGVVIIVNYTTKAKTIGTHNVLPHNYEVIL
ncbi:MAG: DUF5696 domain-containing protein [Acholeplasmataceae bacterium]